MIELESNSTEIFDEVLDLSEVVEFMTLQYSEKPTVAKLMPPKKSDNCYVIFEFKGQKAKLLGCGPSVKPHDSPDELSFGWNYADESLIGYVPSSESSGVAISL